MGTITKHLISQWRCESPTIPYWELNCQQHEFDHAFSFGALNSGSCLSPRLSTAHAHHCNVDHGRQEKRKLTRIDLVWLWRCGLTGVSCLTVQETSRGDYPEPPPPAPCHLLMTWMRESPPLPLIMVSQTEHFSHHTVIHFSPCSAYILSVCYFLRYSFIYATPVCLVLLGLSVASCVLPWLHFISKCV